MKMRAWVWVGTLAWVAAACGGKAEQPDPGAQAAAGRPAFNEEDDAPVTSAPSVGGGTSIVSGGASSVSVSVGVGGDEAGAGGDGGADGVADFDYVSKLFGFECPAEVCAGTVAATDCTALPSGVVRTAEAACDGDSAKYEFVRTLSYELSATRRKACYYAQASFEAPALLVGVEAWDDKPDLFDGTKSHVGAGTYPSRNCYAPIGPTTLCDLQNPAQEPPSAPNVPPRACFNGFSGTCEPCCENTGDTHPDCTGKPEGYPGFACTPPASGGLISYCACSCDHGDWTCAC